MILSAEIAGGRCGFGGDASGLEQGDRAESVG